MNMPDLEHERPGNEAFDRNLRAIHAGAIAHVSTSTMAQLHQRRHQALARRAPRGFGWPLPAAVAATLAVAIGLGLGLGGLEQSAPGPVTTITAQQGGDTLEDALDSLDQSPDFYAWLGSSDAELLAME